MMRIAQDHGPVLVLVLAHIILVLDRIPVLDRILVHILGHVLVRDPTNPALVQVLGVLAQNLVRLHLTPDPDTQGRIQVQGLTRVDLDLIILDLIILDLIILDLIILNLIILISQPLDLDLNTLDPNLVPVLIPDLKNQLPNIQARVRKNLLLVLVLHLPNGVNPIPLLTQMRNPNIPRVLDQDPHPSLPQERPQNIQRQALKNLILPLDPILRLHHARTRRKVPSLLIIQVIILPHLVQKESVQVDLHLVIQGTTAMNLIQETILRPQARKLDQSLNILPVRRATNLIVPPLIPSMPPK